MPHSAREAYAAYNSTVVGLLGSAGNFSFDLSPRCVATVLRMLQLRNGERVLWVGCGLARELLALAGLLPEGVSVHVHAMESAAVAPEMFECVRRAVRKLGGSAPPAPAVCTLGGLSLELEAGDAMALTDARRYTRVYSAALLDGPQLAQHLLHLCRRDGVGRLVMYRGMWLNCDSTLLADADDSERVSLCGRRWSTTLVAVALAADSAP